MQTRTSTKFRPCHSERSEQSPYLLLPSHLPSQLPLQLHLHLPSHLPSHLPLQLHLHLHLHLLLGKPSLQAWPSPADPRTGASAPGVCFPLRRHLFAPIKKTRPPCNS